MVGSEAAIVRDFFVCLLLGTVTGIGFFGLLLKRGPQFVKLKTLISWDHRFTRGLFLILPFVAVFSLTRALYLRREVAAFQYAREAVLGLDAGQVPSLSAVTEDDFTAAIADFAGSPMGTLSDLEMVDDDDSRWLIDAKTEEGAVWRLHVQNERMQGATSTGRFLFDYLWPDYAVSFVCRYDLQPWSDDHPYGLVPVEVTESPSSR